MEIENSWFVAIIGNYVYFRSYYPIQESGDNLYSLNESGIYKLTLDGSTSEYILKASDSEYYVCSAPRILFISENEFYCSFETRDSVDEGTY